MTKAEQRESLVDEGLAYLRFLCREELTMASPEHWDQAKHEQMVEEQISSSRRILDALELRELDSITALERHGESVVAELRARIHQESDLENRTKQA